MKNKISISKAFTLKMSSWLTAAFVALPAILLFSSVAFSAGSYKRLIIFGDSLSDLGTYARAAGPMGGGQFTTNPGPIWAKLVANKLGLPLKVNRQEGFGLPLKLVGGFDYAQGGARITATNDSSTDTKSTARPLKEQLGYFLADYKNFKSDDLIFMQGGANDLFAQLTALGAGQISAQQAIENMQTAALDLAALVSQVNQAGAEHLAIINLPAIEQTPRVLGFDPQTQKLIQMMVQTFNQVLRQQTLTEKVTYVDFYSFDVQFNQNYRQYGFTNISQPACRIDVLPGHSSLFCGIKSLVNPKANLFYKFADAIHPTTGFSRVVAQFIYSQL